MFSSLVLPCGFPILLITSRTCANKILPTSGLSCTQIGKSYSSENFSWFNTSHLGSLNSSGFSPVFEGEELVKNSVSIGPVHDFEHKAATGRLSIACSASIGLKSSFSPSGNSKVSPSEAPFSNTSLMSIEVLPEVASRHLRHCAVQWSVAVPMAVILSETASREILLE